MDSKRPSAPSYEEFMELCASYRLESVEQRLKELNQLSHHYYNHNIPYGSCLIDYTRRSYIFLSENVEKITGYHKAEMVGGPEVQIARMLPEDRHVFRNQLFPEILNFLKGVSPGEFERYRFSFTYRYFRKDGNITHLLQHGTYLEPTDNHLPLLNLVTFTDISDFVTNNTITLSIGYLTDHQGYINVLRKNFPVGNGTALSGRELEVLRLSLEGLSSRLIAEKLHLSPHTIKNHKRNMMEKTSTNSIEELIHCAMKNRLIG